MPVDKSAQCPPLGPVLQYATGVFKCHPRTLCQGRFVEALGHELDV